MRSEGEVEAVRNSNDVPMHTPEYVATMGAHLGNVDDRDAHLEWGRERGKEVGNGNRLVLRPNERFP